MSESKQPPTQHTLYAAKRALGAIPAATPRAYPSVDAGNTYLPAAMDAVCVPCPSVSSGDLTSAVSFIRPEPFEKNLAPTSLRLQEVGGNEGPDAQTPRHRVGTGPSPRSWKLRWDGEMPVSTMAMTRSAPKSESASSAEGGEESNPRNRGERVVARRRTRSGTTAATPGAEVWIKGPPSGHPAPSPSEAADADITAASYQCAWVGYTDGFASASTRTMYVRSAPLPPASAAAAATSRSPRRRRMG
nr:unnamed protein product [Digitaria exilis]